MYVLGLNFGHDASVALCNEEGVVFSIAEERISRIKHHYGFPYNALNELFKYTNITVNDIDALGIAGSRIWYPAHNNVKVVSANGNLRAASIVNFLKRNLADVLGANPIKKLFSEFPDRNPEEFESYLKKIGLLRKNIPVYQVAHHRAHASTAFRLSGQEQSCVITLDGKGDGLSGTIYKGHKDGKLELIRKSLAKDSLGAFYQAVTEALGFMPADGEFKTMGLAALGNKKDGETNPFDNTLSVNDGVLHSSITWEYESYNNKYPDKKVPNPVSCVTYSNKYELLLERHSPEQLAFYAQEHFEDVLLDYIKDALLLTGCKTLSGAGGAMLNVKGNSLVREKLNIEEFFIFPDSPDSGLSIGAALEALFFEGKITSPIALDTPYLGNSYRRSEIDAEIENYNKSNQLNIIPVENDLSTVANKIANGKVIGSFLGRMEFGPRALGNRSVLADPRHERTKDRINLLLKGREPFVPFAPILLEEDANDYWSGDINYRYMTFSVNANEHSKHTVPVVVHYDGSMRPQVVNENSNSWIYKLLKEFKSQTGTGLLVNTSFNRHGHPIVGSPKDALDHLCNDWIDGIVFEHVYVEKI